MAEMVALGTTEEIHALKEKIRMEAKSFLVNGLKLEIQPAAKGKFAVLECDFKNQDYENNDSELFFKRYFANVISDLILNNWEQKIVHEILKDNYYFFTPEEKEVIYQRSLELIKTGHPTKCKTVVYQLNRKAKVNNRLSEYLETNNKINIDGFIRFRLKDYVADLADAVSYAVDEYMMEKEYREFIKLLRYFVEIQEPRLHTVHLVIKEDKKHLLFDDKQQEISHEYIDGFFNEIIDGDVNYEDLLISALITIAPKKLYIHFAEKIDKNDTIITIEEVFNQRVEVCHGCQWCQKHAEN